jgi:cytochrome b6-f complex iron-sulfur subunit
VSPGLIAFILVALALLLWAAFITRTVRGRNAAAGSEAGSGSATEPTERRSPVTMMRGTIASLRARRERSSQEGPTVTKVPEEEQKPVTEETVAMNRRQFLNRVWGLSVLAFLGVFGMGTLSFLWPSLTAGFGTKLSIGPYKDLVSKVGPDNDFIPLFFPDGRFWLTYYDGTGDDPAYLANGAKKTKLQALYRKCVHLGCSVPFCNKSYLYECPCHGSKYTLAGEYFAGPAPRGLDRFPVTVSGGKVSVDTSKVITGPPRGASTWPQFGQPKGPFCVPT